MKDNLDTVFKNLANKFDIEEPPIGHFNRFEAKLNNQKSGKNRYKIITTIVAAASVILFIGIWIGNQQAQKGLQLASVSAEMQESQNYFVSVIQKELHVIENERNKDTEQLISDGLNQLHKLEQQYNILTFELKENAEDKRIIYAMILNFQQRIEVLQSLLQQIENVKQLKTPDNENYI
jgi:hypothetical protein